MLFRSVLIQLLKLLHPFMPFITEEIYQALPRTEENADFLMLSDWPVYDAAHSFPSETAAMESVMDAIRAIRARRAEMNVAPGRKVQLTIVTGQQEVFAAGEAFFRRLAGASEVHVTDTAPDAQGMVEVVTHTARVFIPLAELVDLATERARLAKEIEKTRKGLEIIAKKLGNKAFTAKAPEAVVSAEREKEEDRKSVV